MYLPFARKDYARCTEARLPKDDPMLVAWEAYKATPEFVNTRHWAAVDAHRDGSLWAAFVQGWLARMDADESRLKALEAENTRNILRYTARGFEAGEKAAADRVTALEAERGRLIALKKHWSAEITQGQREVDRQPDTSVASDLAKVWLKAVTGCRDQLDAALQPEGKEP